MKKRYKNKMSFGLPQGDKSFTNLSVSNTLVAQKRLVASDAVVNNLTSDNATITNAVIDNAVISNLTFGGGSSTFPELTVNGNITSLNGNIKANTGSIEAGGGLKTNSGGLTVLAGGANITGDVNATGLFTNVGNASISGTLNVSNALSTNGSLTVAGDSFLEGNVNITGTLGVTGSSTLTDVKATGALIVNGSATVNGDVAISGTVSTTAGINVTGVGVANPSSSLIGQFVQTNGSFTASNVLGQYSFAPSAQNLDGKITSTLDLPSGNIRLVNVTCTGFSAVVNNPLNFKINGDAITSTSSILVTTAVRGTSQAILQINGIFGQTTGSFSIFTQNVGTGDLLVGDVFTISFWILN